VTSLDEKKIPRLIDSFFTAEYSRFRQLNLRYIGPTTLQQIALYAHSIFIINFIGGPLLSASQQELRLIGLASFLHSALGALSRLTSEQSAHTRIIGLILIDMIGDCGNVGGEMTIVNSRYQRAVHGCPEAANIRV